MAKADRKGRIQRRSQETQTSSDLNGHRQQGTQAFILDTGSVQRVRQVIIGGTCDPGKVFSPEKHALLSILGQEITAAINGGYTGKRTADWEQFVPKFWHRTATQRRVQARKHGDNARPECNRLSKSAISLSRIAPIFPRSVRPCIQSATEGNPDDNGFHLLRGICTLQTFFSPASGKIQRSNRPSTHPGCN
ncbi:MAG: hypothetical protein ACKON9_15305, partial [Planctomycetaceae bacterium]